MIIYENENQNSTLQYYDCFSTLANQQVHANNMADWQDTVSSHSPEGSTCKNWYGTNTVAELRGMLELYGWGEGAIAGQQKFGHIKAPPLPSIKRKRCKGSQGHTLNIQAIYNGKFDKAWNTTRKSSAGARKKKTGNVNVVIDIGGSCSLDSSVFFWRGAVGVMLAKALQKSGRNVRILVAASAQGYTTESGPGTDYLCTVINCKDFGEPVALDRLFAMTALSGFFRYYIFKAWCSQQHRMSWGFGSPRTIEDSDLAPLVDDNPCIIVSDIWTESHAVRVVDSLLERFK